MITRLLRSILIFNSIEFFEKEKDYLEVVCTVNVISTITWFTLFKFLARKLLIISENWYYFKAILGLYQLFMPLEYWELV